MFPQNNDRILRELAAPIHVIVGNPPYSVGQTSANDLNANLKYPTLDGRIADTYARALDGDAEEQPLRLLPPGLPLGHRPHRRPGRRRLRLQRRLDRRQHRRRHPASPSPTSSRHIYVYNLRGNQRTAGELSRREGGKVFGAGSRNTVAIFVGVKDPTHTGPCEVHYRDIGDYLSREEKLRIVADSSLTTVDWKSVTPEHLWRLDHSARRRVRYLARYRGQERPRIACSRTYSRGLTTSRDSLVLQLLTTALEANINRTIAFYNSEVERINSIKSRVVPTPAQ